MFRKDFKHYNLFDQLNVKTGEIVNNSDAQLELLKESRQAGVSPDKIQAFLKMYAEYFNAKFKK